ncbi:MAG: DUF1579 family protein [Planctomycetaceae bacterium]|jgi:hypothetical protein|nr:DUF1579 family protein [Planctomycetaceae bacterium]
MSKEILRALCGSWRGTCQTWFEPEMLADTAEVFGTIEPVMDGKFARFVYRSTIQGRPRQGEELIAFNSINQQFEVSWIDDFHMSDAILFSQGPAIAQGFEVTGQYEVGSGLPTWGWKTRYELLEDGRLRLTAFNIMPGEDEAKALETILARTTA